MSFSRLPKNLPSHCHTCDRRVEDRKTLSLSPHDNWVCPECSDYWTWWNGQTDAEKKQEHYDTYLYLLKHGAADPGVVEQLWKT